jgi:hypothetical protein
MALCLSFGLGASADSMAVPAGRQITLLLKVLTYDRQLESKAGDSLVIGVVSVPTDAESAKASEQVQKTLYAFRGKTVKKLPLDFFVHDYTDPDKLEAWIKRHAIDIVYLAPGNQANVAAIVAVARRLKLTTVTGVPAYVEKGVAVGIGERQSKPQILINLTSARQEGSDFDSSLLRIATVIK